MSPELLLGNTALFCTVGGSIISALFNFPSCSILSVQQICKLAFKTILFAAILAFDQFDSSVKNQDHYTPPCFASLAQSESYSST